MNEEVSFDEFWGSLSAGGSQFVIVGIVDTTNNFYCYETIPFRVGPTPFPNVPIAAQASYSTCYYDTGAETLYALAINGSISDGIANIGVERWDMANGDHYGCEYIYGGGSPFGPEVG